MCEFNNGAAALPRYGFEEIAGGDGLQGAASHGFITIRGPCGDHHLLSKAAASALHRWLGSKLTDIPVAEVEDAYARLLPVTPELCGGHKFDPMTGRCPCGQTAAGWINRIGEYVCPLPADTERHQESLPGEWVSDALAKERAHG
jgi:hypothetical protein